MRWAWLDWGLYGWLTTLLQCFDTVGWVIRPVKTVGRITYIVLVQTLNHAQSISQAISNSLACLFAAASSLREKHQWFIVMPSSFVTCHGLHCTRLCVDFSDQHVYEGHVLFCVILYTALTLCFKFWMFCFDCSYIVLMISDDVQKNKHFLTTSPNFCK